VAACSLKPATPAAKGEDINAAMVANGHATAYRSGLTAGATRVHIQQTTASACKQLQPIYVFWCTGWSCSHAVL
jgi:endonuclease YncB( thermonuclease family)